MNFNLLLADNDANHSSLLKKDLMNTDYRLFQAESREMALQCISNCRIDAAIVDLDLPGGVKEILFECKNNSIPLITTGNQTLDESEYLIEIMYEGIPYITKLNTEGTSVRNTIITKINRMLRSVLIFGNNKDYLLGLCAGFTIEGYNITVADKAEDLEYLYNTERPQMIILYYPKHRDLAGICRIRKTDEKVHILIISKDTKEYPYNLVKKEALAIITQDMVSRYIAETWLRPHVMNQPYRPGDTR